MGDVVRHLPHSFHQVFDAVEHGIDAQCKLVELIARPFDGNALREIALHDGARRAIDDFN
jgi:hypothetical protein